MMNIVTTLFAVTQQISPSDIGYNNPTTSAGGTMTSVLSTVYLWAGIICVIVMIVAGYFYVASNGNPTAVKRAKDALMGAIVGLIVVILAFTITQFVIGRF